MYKISINLISYSMSQLKHIDIISEMSIKIRIVTKHCKKIKTRYAIAMKRNEYIIHCTKYLVQ